MNMDSGEKEKNKIKEGELRRTAGPGQSVISKQIV